MPAPTIEQLQREVVRLRSQVQYWKRRRSHNAQRKARWRAANPDKAKAAMDRQRDSGYFKRYYDEHKKGGGHAD